MSQPENKKKNKKTLSEWEGDERTGDMEKKRVQRMDLHYVHSVAGTRVKDIILLT